MDFTPRLAWRDIDQFKFRAAWEGCEPRTPCSGPLISARLSYQLHLQPLTTPSHTAHASTRGTSPAFLLRCLRGRGSIDVPQGSVTQCWPHSPEHPSLGSNSRDTARARRAVTGRYRLQQRVSVRPPTRTEGQLARKTMSMAPQAYMILPVMDPKCL